MNKVVFNEIMNLDSTNELGLAISINILNKFAKVDLLMGEKNQLYYSVNVNDLLLSDITSEDLIDVRNGGWKLSEDKKNIIKEI